VLLFPHIPFVVNRPFNAAPTERLKQHSALLEMNSTYRTFLLWRLQPGWPSHPGQSITLLWLETLRSKCTKLNTVGASNNREPTSCSFYFCLFVPHIYGCCWSGTSQLYVRTASGRCRAFHWSMEEVVGDVIALPPKRALTSIGMEVTCKCRFASSFPLSLVWPHCVFM